MTTTYKQAYSSVMLSQDPTAHSSKSDILRFGLLALRAKQFQLAERVFRYVVSLKETVPTPLVAGLGEACSIAQREMQVINYLNR